MKTYRPILLTGVILLSIHFLYPLTAQVPDPAKAAHDLREGYLLVRFPAYRAKVDTLNAMIQRAEDPDKKARLEKMLSETRADRDRQHEEYKQAFASEYRYSKVAYFYDFDAHHLQSTTYYLLDGMTILQEELAKYPLFYLHFERTSESRIDALVIYDQNGQKVPPPFPNNFSRGGINLIFLKIADRKFPAWRVEKMNKRMFRYLSELKT